MQEERVGNHTHRGVKEAADGNKWAEEEEEAPGGGGGGNVS